MIENVNGQRKMASLRRVALTSLLVASGIGVVGVVPALAANNSSPAPAAFQSDHDRDRGRGHDRVFRDRGDVRYVWYRVCDGTAVGATTTTTTAPETTTETVAQEALAAAVDGAATDTATTTTETTTATTAATTTADDSDDEAYPTFVVVPLPKDEAKAVRKLDERPCYDMTTGAPKATASTTASTTTTDATTDATTTTTTTETTAPAGGR
jgi:hypothetical protein